MRGFILALLAGAAAISTSSADAQTVKYYSRQKLVSLAAPSYSYTATYGAYGACTGGSKTAPVATCKRSDGVTVASTFCAAQVSTCAAPSCGTLQAGYREFAGHSNSMTANTLADAQTACATLAGTIGNGYCSWSSSGKSVTYSVESGLLNGYSGYYGASCTQGG